jgi:hypothetical protein
VFFSRSGLCSSPLGVFACLSGLARLFGTRSIRVDSIHPFSLTLLESFPHIGYVARLHPFLLFFGL